MSDVFFTAPMILPVFLAQISEVQAFAAALLSLAVGYVLAWWFQQKKIGGLLFRQEKERGDFQNQIEAQRAELRQKETEARKSLEASLADKALLEERFALFKEAAQRREGEAQSQMTRLENELTTTREVAAQLVPTQARIGDLEAALNAERGRLNAVEQTLEVTQRRAQELEQQSEKSQKALEVMKEKTSAREADLVRQLAEREQAQANHLARLGTVDEEMSRLKENQTAYQTSAESRIAGLQRQLAAAEARAAMVQKEFMSAVGVLPEPSTQTSVSSDKRVHELEMKIQQLEAEGRKKAREDSYKIAELEYRLSEAQEGLSKVRETEGQAAEVEALLDEVKSLLAQKESLIQDLESLKSLKAKAVEPVPEVMEQGMLPIEDAAREQ